MGVVPGVRCKFKIGRHNRPRRTTAEWPATARPVSFFGRMRPLG